MFFGQCGHFLVTAQTVGLCVVLIRQLCYLPLVKQFGKHIFWLPPHNKQPVRVKEQQSNRKCLHYMPNISEGCW